MTIAEPATIARFVVDSLEVLVFETRALTGRAAARDVARQIVERQGADGRTNVVFAAAPSQNEFLAGLVAHQEIDWTRVLGLPHGRIPRHRRRPSGLVPPISPGAPLPTRRPGPDRLRLIPGEQADRPLRTCLDYEDLLHAEPTDIVCAGIGENGHLAFNDPPVADFLDPVLVKVVRLDAACRSQQLNDGCFERIEDVPTHAYTLTVPALLRRRWSR